MSLVMMQSYSGKRVGTYNLIPTVSMFLYHDTDAQAREHLISFTLMVYAKTSSALNRQISGTLRVNEDEYVHLSLPAGSSDIRSNDGLGEYKYYRSFTFSYNGSRYYPIDIAPGETFHIYFSISASGVTSGWVTTDLLYPATVTITPPAQVATSAVNAFTCTPFTIPAEATASAFGVIGSSAGRVDLYYDATTKLTDVRDAQISGFYWYPTHVGTASEFSGGVAAYTLKIKITDSNRYFYDYDILTFIGDSGTINYNTTPPAAAAPTLTLSTEEVAGIGLLAEYGKYIKGKSRVKFTASYVLKYGATVSSFETIAAGIWSPLATQTIYPSVDGVFESTIEDNHGAEVYASQNYYVYDYWDPSLPTIAIHRCKQNGTHDDSGAYVHIEWGISVAPLGDQNSKVLTITHPEGTTQPTLAAYDSSGSLVVAADTEQSYDIVFTLTDDFATITRTVRLSTAGVIMDFFRTGKGIAFGKVAEYDETLEVAAGLTTILNTTNGKKIDLIDALKKLATKTGVDIYVAEQSANS